MTPELARINDYERGFREGVEAAARIVEDGACIPGYRAFESSLPPGLFTHVAAIIRSLQPTSPCPECEAYRTAYDGQSVPPCPLHGAPATTATEAS